MQRRAQTQASVFPRQKRLFLQDGSRASGWGCLCQRGEEGQATGREYDTRAACVFVRKFYLFICILIRRDMNLKPA